MTIIHAHALAGLNKVPAESVHTCITSPPYFALRDYGTPPVKWPNVTYRPMSGVPMVRIPKWEGEMGQEPTLEMFIGHMVDVFRGVRRTLRKDGTLWVNMGDSYNAGGRVACLKPKDLMAQPWRVALALQADGWFLRSEIIWNKPNPMPECTRDRPTKAHEHLFLFSKSERYFYDGAAIRELAESEAGNREEYRGGGDYAQHSTLMTNRRVPTGWDTTKGEGGHGTVHRTGRTNKAGKNAMRGQGQNREPERQANREGRELAAVGTDGTRNKRDVWTVPTFPFSGAHFATFPPDLIRPCVRAGAPAGGVVLDPFAGSGTTGQVALEEGREPVMIELLEENLKLIRERCTVTVGLPLEFTAPTPAPVIEAEPELFEP